MNFFHKTFFLLLLIGYFKYNFYGLSCENSAILTKIFALERMSFRCRLRSLYDTCSDVLRPLDSKVLHNQKWQNIVGNFFIFLFIYFFFFGQSKK